MLRNSIRNKNIRRPFAIQRNHHLIKNGGLTGAAAVESTNRTSAGSLAGVSLATERICPSPPQQAVFSLLFNLSD